MVGGDETCKLRRAGGVRWEAWLGCSLSPDLGSTLLLTTAPCWNHVGESSATERRGILSNSERLPRNLNLVSKRTEKMVNFKELFDGCC